MFSSCYGDFGPGIGTYAVISIIVSYLICGHRSVYSSQMIFMKKGEYFTVAKSDFGNTKVKARPKGGLAKIIKLIRNKQKPKII